MMLYLPKLPQMLHLFFSSDWCTSLYAGTYLLIKYNIKLFYSQFQDLLLIASEEESQGSDGLNNHSISNLEP